MSSTKDVLVFVTGLGVSGALAFVSFVLFLFVLGNSSGSDDQTPLLLILSGIGGVVIGYLAYRFVRWSNK